MGLRVQLFGEFKVWRDGQLVAESAWKNVRTKELFKRLVIELGRHFKAESLATLFWPETDPTSALSALRTRVSELRSALEPGLANGRKSGYLQKVDEGYRLKPDAQITVDVKQFQSLCEAAGREESQGKLRKAAASYEEAIQLYQGPFLKDDLYLDWTQDYREDFRNSFIKVVLHCAECCARLGQYRKAIEVCNQALAKEKEVRSEEVIKKLMLFHYLSGDEAEAVRMFERYAATLRQEQAECSPETIRLYEQIKAQFVSGVDVYPTKTNSLPLHIPYTLSPGSVPFVGRAEELDLLRTCFEEASTGQGCLMIIGGEAGSGKSRLVEQFLKTMPNHGHLALRGRAEGLGAQIPYRIWSELLRQGLKKAGPEGMRKIPSPYLAEFAKIVPELRSKVQEIPTLPLLSPQQEQRRFFEGIWHVLLGLGEASGVLGTTLLFLEDLHWADETSLSLLEFGIPLLQQKRFFIVGTYRTEEAKESDRLAELIRTLEKHEHGRVIKLGPLALHETLELLRQLPLRLKEQDLFYGLLSQSAEGNPLFLLAILQNLFERGYLRVKGRYWTLAGERLEKLKELAIPPTLQELILQRLNRLANTDRQLLGLASVLGRSFETSLLLRAWDGGKEECHASLVRMVSAQLLAEKHGTFEFSHDRIREMVYTQLPETIRRLMHQRVMRALEAQQSEQINEYAMPLARHAFEAEEWGKAMEYAAKALREAHRQCRLRDGLDLSAIGLKAADMLPASEDPSLGLHRYDLLDGRSEILYLLGKTEEQEQTLNQMEIVAAKLNDGAKRAKALVKKGGLYRAAGEFDKSEKVTQEALALYEKAGDKRGMGSCLMVLAAAKNLRGEYANAIQTNLQALGLLEAIGDRANQVRCLGNLGICHNNLGEYEEALRYYHRILENFKEVQDNPNRASDLNGLGLLYFNLGQYEKALAHCGEALALRREIGDRRGQVFSLTNLGDACCAIGKYEEALRYYQEAQKICKEVGNRWIEGHGLGGIGDVHRSRGEHSEALEYYSRAMKTFKELNANAEYLFYLTWASRAHLLNGAKGIALEFSTEAMDMLKQGWTHVTPHDTLFTHSLALEANGQDSEAAGHLERAYASLMEQADKLKDNSLRDSFLNRIRAHREILDAWEKLDAPPHWSSDR